MLLAYILQDMEKAFDPTRPMSWWRILRFLRKMTKMVKVLRTSMLSETSNTVGGLTDQWPFLRLSIMWALGHILLPAWPVRASVCNIQPSRLLMSKKPSVRKKGCLYSWTGCDQTCLDLSSSRSWDAHRDLAGTFETLMSPEFYKEQLCQRFGLPLIFNCPAVNLKIQRCARLEEIYGQTLWKSLWVVWVMLGRNVTVDQHS